MDRVYLHGVGVDAIAADDDLSGNVVARVDAPGTTADAVSEDDAWLTVYGWTGRPWDAMAGLSDHRARWYDPSVGQFIHEDPIGFEGGDSNLYRYVGNEPGVWIDPSGLSATSGTANWGGFGALTAGLLATQGVSHAGIISSPKNYTSASVQPQYNPAQGNSTGSLQSSSSVSLYTSPLVDYNSSPKKFYESFGGGSYNGIESKPIDLSILNDMDIGAYADQGMLAAFEERWSQDQNIPAYQNLSYHTHLSTAGFNPYRHYNDQAGDVVMVDARGSTQYGIKFVPRNIPLAVAATTASAPLTLFRLRSSSVNSEYSMHGIELLQSNTPESITVYNHGFDHDYNSAYQEALNVQTDLRNNGSNTTVIGFAWNADSKQVVGNMAIGKTQFTASVRAADQVALTSFDRFMADLRREYPDTPINIMSHSLGNRVTLKWSSEGKSSPFVGVNHAILINAAVDNESLQYGQEFANAANNVHYIHNVYSQDDFVLEKFYSADMLDNALGETGVEDTSNIPANILQYDYTDYFGREHSGFKIKKYNKEFWKYFGPLLNHTP